MNTVFAAPILSWLFRRNDFGSSKLSRKICGDDFVKKIPLRSIFNELENVNFAFLKLEKKSRNDSIFIWCQIDFASFSSFLRPSVRPKHSIVTPCRFRMIIKLTLTERAEWPSVDRLPVRWLTWKCSRWFRYDDFVATKTEETVRAHPWLSLRYDVRKLVGIPDFFPTWREPVAEVYTLMNFVAMNLWKKKSIAHFVFIRKTIQIMGHHNHHFIIHTPRDRGKSSIRKSRASQFRSSAAGLGLMPFVSVASYISVPQNNRATKRICRTKLQNPHIQNKTIRNDNARTTLKIELQITI